MNTASSLTTPVPLSSETQIKEDPQTLLAEVASRAPRRPDDELRQIYEVARTVDELTKGGWRRIGLQFPDYMLRDGVRVFELLEAAFREQIRQSKVTGDNTSTEDAAGKEIPVIHILADTSYSPCCVDAIAAEHVNADVVVHYGRACLSTVTVIDVIYVFTKQPMDIETIARAYESELEGQKSQGAHMTILMADCTYQWKLQQLADVLKDRGHLNIATTEILPDSESLLPNRTIKWPDVEVDLATCDVFYIGEPPRSLLLTLSSRIRNLLVCPVISIQDSTRKGVTSTLRETTALTLRKRYGMLTSMNSAPIIGILVNTLSLTGLVSTIAHVKHLIETAGKKSYTVVVGKINVAKLANFSEIGGWVCLGCWESSLGGQSDGDGGLSSEEGFWKPVITPFELTVMLMGDEKRTWGGEWRGGMEGLMMGDQVNNGTTKAETESLDMAQDINGSDHDSEEESAPPEYDLRTGRLIPRTVSRPMAKQRQQSTKLAEDGHFKTNASPTQKDMALTTRSKGEVSQALRQGTFSPGAAYLQNERTWQGLGSDFDRAEANSEDAAAKVSTGSVVEEGRRGVARGYVVGTDDSKH